MHFDFEIAIFLEYTCLSFKYTSKLKTRRKYTTITAIIIALSIGALLLLAEKGEAEHGFDLSSEKLSLSDYQPDSGELISTDNANEEPPWEFLVVGLAACAFGLWVMRIDKPFSQNLRRSLTHATQFIGDIRDRRFLQGAQTGILILLLTVGFGNLSASIAYSLKQNLGFCALLEHIFSENILLFVLRSVIWTPYEGVVFFTVLTIILTFLIALLFRIASYGQPVKITTIQSVYIFYWSSVPMLIVVPISALFLRIESIHYLQVLAVLAIVWSFSWSYIRMIKAYRIAYKGSYNRPLLVGFVFPVLLVSAYLIHLQISRQTLDHIGYFYSLFIL